MKALQILRAVKHRSIRAARRAAERVVVRGAYRQVMPYAARADAGRPQAERRTPRFLIARYKYYAADASMGPSIEKYTLDDTLSAARLGTAETFFWDSPPAAFPRGDWALLDTCRRVRPDAVILSSYEPGYASHPSIETIRVLRRTWKIPVIAIWWDTAWQGFWPSIQSVMPFVDVHVVTDNPLMNFFDEHTRRSHGSRFLSLWEPVDPLSYNNPGRKRDLDVAFLGQIGTFRSPRVAHVQALMEHNIPIFCSLSSKAEQPSHEKYLEVLKRTKIGLNFSHSPDSHALKWRVFETMSCGALLMENDNPQTSSYFTPMRDYVTFESPADLVDKARYYLARDDERSEIAARGEQRVSQFYSHVHFWQAIIDKLEAVKDMPL